MFETILFSQEDSIATITLNRPQAMNSFNDKMAVELKKITDEIRKNNAIRAVLLNGSGSLFMAGGDIQFFYQRLETMPQGVLEIIEALNVTIMNLVKMPKPIIASVHGSVAGVGMSLMMASDLVIAAEDTQFTMAYSGIGISPDGGSSYFLPRIVGTKKAMEWLLLSDIFDAKTAYAHGLINWTCPKENLATQTQKLLLKLANGPTFSFQKIKRLVHNAWVQDLKTQLNNEADAFVACTTSTDFNNGVRSFLKKERSQFIGK